MSQPVKIQFPGGVQITAHIQEQAGNRLMISAGPFAVIIEIDEPNARALAEFLGAYAADRARKPKARAPRKGAKK